MWGVIKLWYTNAVVGKGEVNEKSGNNYVFPRNKVRYREFPAALMVPKRSEGPCIRVCGFAGIYPH